MAQANIRDMLHAALTEEVYIYHDSWRRLRNLVAPMVAMRSSIERRARREQRPLTEEEEALSRVEIFIEEYAPRQHRIVLSPFRSSLTNDSFQIATSSNPTPIPGTAFISKTNIMEDILAAKEAESAARARAAALARRGLAALEDNPAHSTDSLVDITPDEDI